MPFYVGNNLQLVVMAVSKDFLNYVLDLLSPWGEVYTKRMFGGIGLYRDDFAFAMVWRDTVYLKVDDTNVDKYIQEGSVQLKPFKSEVTVPTFYNIPPDVFEDTEQFIEWAKESLAIQKKLTKEKNMKKREK